jgi:hypothetical protein
MNRSGVRSSTVRYEDSNHWRIGGGDLVRRYCRKGSAEKERGEGEGQPQ